MNREQPLTTALRRAVVDDAATIAHLHVEGWRGAYRGLLSDAYLDALSADEQIAARESQFQEGRPVELWLVERGDEPVGFAAIGPSRDDDLDRESVGELYAIYVLREHWDAGAGRSVLEQAAARLRALGFDEAVLWVLSPNVRARRFYERAGWTPDGATKVEEVATEPHEELRYRTSLVHR